MSRKKPLTIATRNVTVGGTDDPDDDNLVKEIQRLVRRDKSPPARVTPPTEPR